MIVLSFLFQIIQEEIDSHGKVLKSILRTCQESAANNTSGGVGQRQSDEGAKEEEEEEESPSKNRKKKRKKKKTASSAALTAELANLLPEIESLEDRWHQIGLRALEWQYFLEGLAWTEDATGDDDDDPQRRRRKRQILKQVRGAA